MKFGLTQYTLDHFFAQVIEKFADRPALALVGDEPFTYGDFGHRVDKLKSMLRSMGIKKRDNIAILGQSSPNWATAFMAVTTLGAVAVPILDEFPSDDIEHILRHANVKAMFISKSHYDRLNLDGLRSINIIVQLDDFSVLLDDGSGPARLWKQLHELPKVIKALDKTNTADERIDEEDVAEILYTSGTTGHSKGVLLTHKNIVSNLFEGPDVLKVINQHSVILSILPLAHAFGSTSAFLSIIYCGATIYYLTKPPAPKVLLHAMQTVRPTILGAVPLVFEKIYHKQVVPTIAKSPALRLMAKTALTKKLLYKIIGKKIYRLLGGRLDCVIIGGAAFSPEVELFMQQGNIPYCCGYGMSECAPLITFSSMDTQKTGSPGHAIPGVSLKIVNADATSGIGEIYVKGPNVMLGYYKNKEATAAAFSQDGWLITGDRGYIDEDGYLFITGRSKNVIVGPSGENIYPETIEAKLLESIFVEETLVYELEGQLVARIHPNYAYIQEIVEKKKEESAIATDIAKILEHVRREVNGVLPGFSKIARVIEQSSPFIKTPTNKIKRAEYVPGYLGK